MVLFADLPRCIVDAWMSWLWVRSIRQVNIRQLQRTIWTFETAKSDFKTALSGISLWWFIAWNPSSDCLSGNAINFLYLLCRMKICARPIRVWRPSCCNNLVAGPCVSNRGRRVTIIVGTVTSSLSVVPLRWRDHWQDFISFSSHHKCSAKSRPGSLWVPAGLVRSSSQYDKPTSHRLCV